MDMVRHLIILDRMEDGRQKEWRQKIWTKRREDRRFGPKEDVSFFKMNLILCFSEDRRFGPNEEMLKVLLPPAACKNDSCFYGDCVETINSHRCACFEGFYGEKCDQVVQCNKEEVTVPYKGRVNCTHTYGDFSYDSLCEYSCEEGYQLSTPRPLRCTASKRWSEQPPSCELVSGST
uniref:E-selectin-like n=1 Tax=Monopterus albus TaxID=43700 RepID=UPI0009B4D37D|nr:E-selectin-like [Monopterus albus]